MGVIANLAVWFSLPVLFRELQPVTLAPGALELPILSSINVAALTLALLAAPCLLRFRLGVLRTLGINAAAGLVLGLMPTM